VSQQAKTRGVGIMPKIMLAMLLIATAPFGAIWYLDYQQSSQQITEQVKNELGLTADGLTTYADGWVEMNRRMMRQNAGTQAIRSMDGATQAPVLAGLVAEYGWSYLAFTTDNAGINIGRSDGKKLANYSDRAYVKQIIEGREFGQQVLIGKTSGKPAVVMSTGIRQTTGDSAGKLVGVFAIASNLDDIATRITSAKIGDTGYAFAIDEAGDVVAHPDDQFTKERKNMARHPAVAAFLAGGEGYTTFVDEQGVKWASVSRKGDYGWNMFVIQRHDEAFAPLAAATQKAMVIGGITAVLVLLIAWVFARGLTRPIVALTAVADEISRGNLALTVGGTSRGDEIGDLARAIERLGSSVRIAMNRLKREQKKAAASVQRAA
jgi:methyl-accepting chemotaxis protein